ncbi:MAG: ribose 5-phosphate isomerase B [Desulfovibrio sp.]|nr:ribose 5-phosphate isomerase B [Desulfovibrio sp.]MCA1987025.1 ribose 5-phosphate isomerase B [Desulfovibrio sp.]
MPSPASPKRVCVGADHAGFALKEQIKQHLLGKGHDVIDVGTNTQASCDYPEFAQHLCKKLSSKELGECGLGVLVCGTGIGMSMAANKCPGIRAALCTNEFLARMTRRHNNANVLCLGERVTGPGLALAIVDAFLEESFEGGRHQRRVDLMEPATPEACRHGSA